MMRLTKLALISALLSFSASSSAFAQCTGQAGANKFCGNATGSTALPTFTTIPAGSLTPIAGGTVLGNPSASSAVPSATTAPVLGIPGTSTGQVGFAGATSGTAILKPQPATGSPTLLLPNTSGTLAANASSPLALSATTGTLTCPTCVTSSGGGAITGTAPISVSAAGVVSINAPYTTLTASNGGIVYSGSTNLAILAGTATARQMLQSGASAAPAWSTTTWPATTAAGTILVSSTANTITNSATPTLGVPGSVQGTMGFAGLTSGTATITAQSTAGTPTLTLPNASGTFAVAATSPVVLSATTGTLTCPTCVTSSGGGAISGTAPISVSAAGVVSITGAAGQVLAGATPAFTNAPALGVAGASVGSVVFANLTSGSITIRPVTGALGSAVLSLPAATDTLVGKATTDTLTNKTLTSPVIAIIQNTSSTQFLNGASANGIQVGSVCAETAYANCSSVPSFGVYTKGDIAMAGSTSGLGTLKAPAVASTYVWTLPTVTSTLAGTVASGTSALGTSAISSATCATVVTTSATGTATTDTVLAGFNGDPTGVTGYAASTSGMLTIIAYPSANNVNFKVCNNTASSITPGAITLNWRVIR